MTVPSKVRGLPLVVPLDLTAVNADVADTLAYRHARFSFATFSEARKRFMLPPAASMPACQSTTRANPAATRCSATLPAGWRTSGYYSTQLSDTENDVPEPINIDAGGGGALLAPAWNGVAVEVGSDSMITRTGRWSSLDSVKNFACNRYNDKNILI